MKTWGFLIAIFFAVVSSSLAQEPTWTQKFPAQSPPSPGAPMAYDSARQQVVLLFTGCGTVVGGDTWVWDGNTWTQKFPTTSPPGRCGNNAIVYDSARSEVVIFGGS